MLGFKNFPLRITHYALRIETLLIILLALSVCISEPLSRNIIRIIFVMFAVKFFIHKDAVMNLTKRYKFLLISISAFAWWMIISSLYGGHLVSDSDSNVYWFFFSHNMILFVPLVMMIRRQKKSEKLLIVTGLSLLIDDFFIVWQLSNGVENPITFLNDSAFQSSILYVILLPTLLILTLNDEENFNKRIFYGATFFISLVAFLFLYTNCAQIVVAIILAAILIESFSRSSKKFLALMTAGIFFIMFQGALQDLGDVEKICVEDVFTERSLIWTSTVDIIEENPIMGVGLGNYDEVLHEKYLAEMPTLKVIHAYNTYMQFWAETGIFGMILFCVIFSWILIWSRRRCGNLYGRILFYSTLSLMLYATTDFIFESYSAMRLYWIMLGVCVASLDR